MIEQGSSEFVFDFQGTSIVDRLLGLEKVVSQELVTQALEATGKQL